MIYSNSIDDMDTYAAPNVRIAFAMSAAGGLPLGIANTLRDQEKQTELSITEGAPKLVTFHAHGLAIDIYINIPGHYYDTSLYPRVAEHFKRVGFSWMWDIAHNEMCHFQWDNHRAITGKDILAGKLPPPMPLYKEILMTKDEAKAIVKEKAELSDATIQYLADDYRYGDELIVKLAKAMK
jgi:hypothetical protein